MKILKHYRGNKCPGKGQSALRPSQARFLAVARPLFPRAGAFIAPHTAQAHLRGDAA